ncbi:MAG TPA: tripartite tricarboxylate transporter substrate binding protein [Ramlibacter sp.]|nr:tripartite tricarboxylate transporter substrate binding protein [Ramlibacter sp.]
MKPPTTLRRRLLGAALLLPLPAFAQSGAGYPSRPIRIVVPYPPAGGPDIIARMLATEFEKGLGATVVENRPGASGMTGADQVAKAPPDGHTLLVTTTATHSINPALYPNVPYDPGRDFTPIARVANTPTVLVVAKDVPAATLSDLIAYAKKNPGKLSYATPGSGTMPHITGELLRQEAGIDVLHVPYKGTAQIVPDLLAGRVSMMFNSPAAVMQFVDQGNLKAIALTSRERLGNRPTLPTMAEAGMPNFEASAWYAVYGPPGMPREVVARLNAEIRRIVALPAVQQRLETMGMQPAASTPDELAQVQQRDLQKWGSLIKARKIVAE